MKKVLNVGGGTKVVTLPPIYEGWQQLWLDIDPRWQPDIVADARQLEQQPPAVYDSVFCMHNLEHYYRHDAVKVLRGFLHVLKDDGFAYVIVPDMAELMRRVVHNNLDIDDFLYEAPIGRVHVHDVIYGFGAQIERSDSDFFAHKTGFTQKSLSAILYHCGFTHVYSGIGPLEILAYAFKNTPTEDAMNLLQLTPASR